MIFGVLNLSQVMLLRLGIVAKNLNYVSVDLIFEIILCDDITLKNPKYIVCSLLP